MPTLIDAGLAVIHTLALRGRLVQQVNALTPMDTPCFRGGIGDVLTDADVKCGINAQESGENLAVAGTIAPVVLLPPIRRPTKL